ncbi:MAG TPA: tetratricopeptide repeat protein [Polyangia bacterium]|nr:tetratricopeptide repeat protein [Polyangia bacterium]
MRRLSSLWNAARARVGMRPLVWGAALTVLAAILDFVPLADVLGYDFSFVLGYGAALAGVDIGHGAMLQRPAALGRAPAGAALARVFGQAAARSTAILVLPLLLSLANAARVRNCSFGAGLAFFALLPVATALYAATTGVLVGLATPRPRRGRLLAFAMPVLSLLWTLLRLYRDPPVFAYDPYGGYFPGPIYDEALRPPLPLLLFRVANVVWAATAIVLALAGAGRGRDPRRFNRAGLAAAFPLLAASIVLYAVGGRLGYHVTRADLARVLDQTLTSDHFVIHYAPAIRTRAELALEREDLEFRYGQLRQTLEVKPDGPITVWDFPDADTKKELVGAGHTLYARPWTREIFVQGEGFPSTRLRHEMAHVFAAAFGDPFFGVSLAWRWAPLPHPVLAVGMIEGLAEAADADAPDGDATIHQEAAAMQAAHLAPPLANVVGAGFSAESGARAYTLAGSFAAYLLQTRGAEKLRALYKSAGNFSDVYRLPLADLEQEWRRFLAAQPLNKQQRAHATEQFRRPAIFARVCARELAARVAEARAQLLVEPDKAAELYASTCADDPAEPIYRLGLARAQLAAGDLGQARATLAHLSVDGSLTEPLQAEVESLSAALDFATQDFAAAQQHQRRALQLASTDADHRLAIAKLAGLADANARATLGRALFGNLPVDGPPDPVLTFFLLTEYARLFPGDRLGPYLVGRQLVGRDPARALSYLDRACGGQTSAPDPAALPIEFARECRRMIADAAYEVGDFVRAREAVSRLPPDATEADRLRALDMRARIDWAASRRDGPVDAR